MKISVDRFLGKRKSCRSSLFHSTRPQSQSDVSSRAMMTSIKFCAFLVAIVVLSWMSHGSAQQKYDLLLKGGHVIDPKNKISAVRDIAIANGKVAAVAAKIDPADALKVSD